MASAEEIKALREETGLSVMECKKALEEAEGDKEKAISILKERGASVAEKKSGRNLGAGTIASYIHANGTTGSMVELLCETDFVGKNPEFKQIAYDVAMHVAAMKPENSEELLGQPFIKDTSKTIQDLVNGAVQKFGERTEIGRFICYTIN